jgi:hypothetical protein
MTRAEVDKKAGVKNLYPYPFTFTRAYLLPPLSRAQEQLLLILQNSTQDPNLGRDLRRGSKEKNQPPLKFIVLSSLHHHPEPNTTHIASSLNQELEELEFEGKVTVLGWAHHEPSCQA